jgi:hypothetical protein
MALASIASITFTRPENTTAYTAGDVIGIADAGTPANAGSAIHELTGAASSSSFVFVQSIQLLVNATAAPSGMAGFRVHLYNAAPTAILDNAAYAFVSGDAAAWQDTYDVGTPAVRGSMLRAQAYYQGGILKLAPASSSLFAVLETSGGFTPASATAFTLRVKLLEAGF